jgi:predicted glycosyltransferase
LAAFYPLGKLLLKIVNLFAMNHRPPLLFHCQHAMGMGHLIRSLALAEALAKKFRVVFLNGGPFPRSVARPESLEIVDLPALGLEMDGTLISRDANQTAATSRSMRREIILDTFRQVRPQVLLIELFPFGRKKFASELMPLLEEANRMGTGAPLTLCSLRDILVEQRKDQFAHEARARLIVNHYFDAVLVHADAQFIRLEETFHPSEPLAVPIHYTGFVFAEKSTTAKAPEKSRRILVSAGGGIAGGELLRNAVAAHKILWSKLALPMTVVAGPFLPEEEWQMLQHAAIGQDGLELKRSVPDLGAEMRASTFSVSQCGYNTTMDLLRSGVKALVVPFQIEGEDEQMNRARRLESLGLLRAINPKQAGAASIADEIEKLNDFKPARVNFDLNGAANTVDLVERLWRERAGARARVPQKTKLGAWLDPLREALDTKPEKTIFFFRDDDAGWKDKRLLALFSLFEHLALPLDVAVIPMAITTELAKKLRSRVEAAPERFSVHQHGFAHTNRETVGRPCEFGPSRHFAEQYADISVGKQLLEEFLGEIVAPFFTPPWNRCTAATGKCLAELGFKVLSRDATATPLNIAGLREVPISVDWFAKRKGEKQARMSREEFGHLLAEKVRRSETVGLMFHHAAMDDAEQALASEMLFWLATHGNAKCRSMEYVARKIKVGTVE